MKKKKLLRFSKRLLILLLCTTLVSGSCFNRHKIAANATSVAVGVGAYTLYEICLYIGTLLVSGIGIGFVVDNRDQIAQMGKDFIDSCDISELSGWVLSKANTTGQSYVYGTEALQEVQSTSFEVIQGGGNSPENNDDNDGDGDVDAEDRTVELKNLGMWATTTFTNFICEQIQPLLDKMDAGEETFLDQYIQEYGYYGMQTPNAAGQYVPLGKVVSPNHYQGSIYSIQTQKILEGNLSNGPIAGVRENYQTDTDGSDFSLTLYCYDEAIDILSVYRSVYTYRLHDENEYESSGTTHILYGGTCSVSEFVIDVNFPVFDTYEAMENYFLTGDDAECINLSESYRIADWLQENWQGSIEALNTGIRSIYDNMLIVGEAANQALLNQLNGLGYVEDLLARIAAALALALPDVVEDPVYYPDTSEEPAIEELPWEEIDPDPIVPDPEPDPDDGDDGTVKDPKIKFGINTIFSILLLLIMIIIMLLIIFISCLAFIIMIFRIEATTGFLPDEMVAALDYLKTLEIPGFGMSVYDFFMALIYIILIFTVIGILRKNIDKIKFPRKGG